MTSKADVLLVVRVLGEADSLDIAGRLDMTTPAAGMALRRAWRQGKLWRRREQGWAGLYVYQLSDRGAEYLSWVGEG